jgi:hypothetical protein
LFGTTSNSLNSVFKVAKPKTAQPLVPPALYSRRSHVLPSWIPGIIGVIWGEEVE